MLHSKSLFYFCVILASATLAQSRALGADDIAPNLPQKRLEVIGTRIAEIGVQLVRGLAQFNYLDSNRRWDTYSLAEKERELQSISKWHQFRRAALIRKLAEQEELSIHEAMDAMSAGQDFLRENRKLLDEFRTLQDERQSLEKSLGLATTPIAPPLSTQIHQHTIDGVDQKDTYLHTQRVSPFIENEKALSPL